MSGAGSRAPRERGSAAVDFTLVAPLVLVVCIAVVQLAVWVVERTEVRATAFDAARAGAVTPGALAARLDVARRAAMRSTDVDGSDARARIDVLDGVRVVVVEIPVRMTLLGWDLPMRSTVAGHVPLEPA